MTGNYPCQSCNGFGRIFLPTGMSLICEGCKGRSVVFCKCPSIDYMQQEIDKETILETIIKKRRGRPKNV